MFGETYRHESYSNRLTSISSNLLEGNNVMDKLILRSNNPSALQWNTPLLNCTFSLSFLYLQTSKWSDISSVTFLLILKLKILNISRNEQALLNSDTLSLQRQLEDKNLENNPWKWGSEFEVLLSWMQSKLDLSHNRTLKCLHKNSKWEIWTQENWSSLWSSWNSPTEAGYVYEHDSELFSRSVK